VWRIQAKAVPTFRRQKKGCKSIRRFVSLLESRLLLQKTTKETNDTDGKKGKHLRRILQMETKRQRWQPTRLQQQTLVLVKKCAADTGNSSCNIPQAKKCCKSIGRFVVLRRHLQGKNNQTTPMAKKTTPLADPANGKEKGKLTATGKQKQTTETCVKN